MRACGRYGLQYTVLFYAHVSVHRDKFLVIKPTRCTNFSNLFCNENLHCFEQFLCPSSGVFHCTHSNDICHTSLLTACERDQDGRPNMQNYKTSRLRIQFIRLHKNMNHAIHYLFCNNWQISILFHDVRKHEMNESLLPSLPKTFTVWCAEQGAILLWRFAHAKYHYS